MNPLIAKRLRDALDACELIVRFTEEQTPESYEADVYLRSAVERQIEILGEALTHVRRLDPILAENMPEIHQSIAMRHRIIHGYDAIDNELVWLATQIQVPALRDRLVRTLQDDSSTTGK